MTQCPVGDYAMAVGWFVDQPRVWGHTSPRRPATRSLEGPDRINGVPGVSRVIQNVFAGVGRIATLPVRGSLDYRMLLVMSGCDTRRAPWGEPGHCWHDWDTWQDSRVTSESQAVYDLLDADVGTLLSHHPTVVSPDAGRPAGDTGPLLRATVVFIHTAWENYLEQVVLEMTLRLLEIVGDDHSRLPAGLRRALTEKVEGGDPWLLAANGWQKLAEDHVRSAVGRLNTPNSEAVEELCKKYLGLRSILDGCGWQNKPAESVRRDLDQLVHEIRGEIVHKGRTPGRLDLGGVRSWRDFINRLVQRFDTHAAEAFEAKHGERPWAP